MRKALTYSGFLIASLVMVATFVTAKTYTQLGVAAIIYPIFVFLVYKILMKGSFSQTIPLKGKVSSIEIQLPPVKQSKNTEKVKSEKVEVVADLDKRTFLKIVGAAGLSYFVFSLLGRKTESLLFGRALDSGTSPLNFQNEARVSTAQGYTISEIDDVNTTTYYGFVNKDGAWFIMREDIEENSYRYANGTSDFTNNWKNRENLRYDLYYNLF